MMYTHPQNYLFHANDVSIILNWWTIKLLHVGIFEFLDCKACYNAAYLDCKSNMQTFNVRLIVVT